MKYLLIFVLIVFGTPAFGQENSSSPEVTFNFLYNQTKGSIKNVEVQLNVNWDDISKAEIKGIARVDDLTTDNKMRDKHLKSEDFFHAEAFPTIEFICTSIEKNENHFIANGEFTIKGVSNSEDFILQMKDGALIWTTTIDLEDYGIEVKKGIGKNKVDIRVEVPFVNL